MSVQHNQTAGVGSTGPTPAPTAAPEGQRPAFSFMNPSSMGVSRNPPNEILAKADKAVVEAISKITTLPEVEVLTMPVDNAKFTRLHLSAVTVIMRFRPGTGHPAVAAHHTLLLEASNVALEDDSVQINGQTFNVPQFSEKVYDQVYADTVASAIQSALTDYKISSVSAEIVPRTFNWDDADAVRRLTVNAICAVGSELQRRAGTGELNLAQTKRDATLKVQVSYNNPETTSAVGLPVRTDLGFKIIAEATDRGDNSSVNQARKSELMAEMGGYIEPIYSPAQGGQGFFGNNQSSLQKYVARLSLTRAESMYMMTPGMQLLTLASCAQLAENAAWWGYFRPRPLGQTANQIDKRDIGALNIEANAYAETGQWGSRLPTKSQTFSDADLGDFLQRAFSPDLAISLDVSNCSDDTWYNEIFAYAAAGGPDGQAAQQALVNAAIEVTNGAFKEFWKGGDVVVQNEDIVLNGYYTYDGQKHDIRDGDLIAILNMVGKDSPSTGAAFTDTFLRVDQPLAKRLLARRNILTDIFGNVTWTGTSRRVTLMAPFIDAFLQGMTKCGLMFRMSNPGGVGDFQSQRGAAAYLRGAAFGTQPTGAFATGFGGGNQNTGYNRMNPSGRHW